MSLQEIRLKIIFPKVEELLQQLLPFVELKGSMFSSSEMPLESTDTWFFV